MLNLRTLKLTLLLSAILASGTGCKVTEAISAATGGCGGGNTAVRTLAFVDGSSYNMGSVSASSTKLVWFAISTTGSGEATISSSSNSNSSFTFNGGTFPGTGGTCTQPITGNCSVAILYTAPATAGSYSNVLTISANSGTISLNINVTVSTGATLTLNGGTPYGFGIKTIGSSTDATLTVANTGGMTATSITDSGLSSPLNFKGGTYPGTGGTCSTSLAASSTCTIVVNFSPVASVLTSNTLTLSYSNGGSTTTSTIGLTGTGATVASLAVTNPIASPYDFGNIAVGATTPGTVTFTLTNSGGQTATSLTSGSISAPFAFKGGSYPGTGGTCGATLAVAATCTLVVDFSPIALGLVNATLVTTYGDASGPQTLNQTLRGTGVAPANLSISDGATYDFGQKITGSNTDFTFTVTNSGGVSATAMSGTAPAAPYSFRGGSYPGTTGTCGATLAAAATCTVVIRFSPVANGTFNATVTLPYNNATANVSATRALTGIGGSPALLSINGGVPFGYGSMNVSTSTDQSLTVANSGTLTATAVSASGLSAPLNFKGGTYPGTGGTCGATLAGGASCTVITTFAPVAGGLISRTLTLDYHNGSIATSATLGVSGTGVALASVAITLPVTNPFDYGSVVIGAAAVDLTITLSNTGEQSATALSSGSISAPYLFKGGSFPGTGGTCGATLTAAGTCTMVVSYLPSSPGVTTDTLVTSYNDGINSQTVNQDVTGTGLNPAILSISNGPSYDFGSKTVGTNTDFTLTVTNSGGATSTTMSSTALIAPFSFKGGTYPGTGGNCSTTLGAGTNCTLVVQFSPVSTGGFSDTITLAYNNGVNATNTTENLTGTGGTVANLSISDGPTYSYGSYAISYTTDKTLTVTNVGSVSASTMNVTGLGAPFTFKGGSYPGTGGTCGTTLGAAGTCTLVVRFAPTSAGASSVTLTLNYNDSVSNTSTTRDLNGVGATITKIVGGGSHTCALYSTGSVKCWGSDFYGQLGDGGANADQTTPVFVGGITTAIDIAAGSNHTCAVLANGRAMCWGSDLVGQLGNNASLTSQGSPALVATITNFVQISAGGDTSCGLRATGSIICWGYDGEGAVGNNAAFTNMTTPATVSGLSSMTDVSVGLSHACGRRSDNTFRCWGSDVNGQLGNGGANTNSGVPVTPAPGTAIAAIAGGSVSCAGISGGSVKCWGSDSDGQLGDSGALADQISPVTVGGLANITALSLGAKHGCAKTAANGMTCWGDDSYGQLGDDVSTTNQPTPVSVSGIANVSVIGVGEYHSCTVLTSGAAYCFGANASGQLGSTPLVQQPTPVLIQGL